jgi:hypothetical protein
MQRPYKEKCETADETSRITRMGLGGCEHETFIEEGEEINFLFNNETNYIKSI